MVELMNKDLQRREAKWVLAVTELHGRLGK